MEGKVLESCTEGLIFPYVSFLYLFSKVFSNDKSFRSLVLCVHFLLESSLLWVLPSLMPKFNSFLHICNSMEILYRICIVSFYPFLVVGGFYCSAMKLLIFYILSQEIMPNWILIKILLPKELIRDRWNLVSQGLKIFSEYKVHEGKKFFSIWFKDVFSGPKTIYSRYWVYIYWFS